MKLSVQANTEVEHNLAPPMASAITLPVHVDAAARGMDVIVYVCTSPLEIGVRTSDRELKAIAKEIASRLTDA